MNKRPNPQADILEQAIAAIAREAGLRVIPEEPVNKPGREVDAVVRIDGSRVFVEVKKWAQHANLGALVDQIKKMPERGMLVADFINPRMGEKLRALDVQYLDTAGNAFVNTPPVYIYIRGNRPAKAAPVRWARQNAYGRAFAPTGLKVIYAFLCNPALVNAPYRRIAHVADAAVGTVGWVLNDLKAGRYVAEFGGRRGRQLVEYRKLLDRWVEVYPEKLRPKHLLGVFHAAVPDWWRRIDVTKFHAQWGGETAAAMLTDSLRPEVATIFLRRNELAKFVARNRLRKAIEPQHMDAQNLVYVLEPFWNEDEVRGELVDPVLTYADLIATADPRNRETAQNIFEKYIADRARKG